MSIYSISSSFVLLFVLLNTDMCPLGFNLLSNVQINEVGRIGFVGLAMQLPAVNACEFKDCKGKHSER